MSSGQPPWRRVFDRAERAIGKPLEDLVATREYAAAVVYWMRLQRAVNGALREALDRPIGTALHIVNLPARTDLRRLSREIAALTGEVRGLANSLDAEVRGLGTSLDEEIRGLGTSLDEEIRGLGTNLDEEIHGFADSIGEEIHGLADSIGELRRPVPPASYEDWSKDELQKRAGEIGIEGRSTMDKGELVNALRNSKGRATQAPEAGR